MKALLKVILFKFLEVAIELIADKAPKVKGWHIEVKRFYTGELEGKISSICLTRE